MKAVKEVNYKISSRNDLLDNVYGITPVIEDKIGEMYLKVQKKKNSAVKELIDLIQKYPRVPHFKNLLSVLYGYQKNHAKASELNRRILKEHPEYLFGKINLALEYIHKQEYEKVPELLGTSLEISELYPYRNEFNYEEVLSYNKAVLLYFIKTNNEEQAEQRFKSMQEMDAESEHTKWAEQQIMMYRLNRGFERMKKENEQRRTVKAVAAKVTDDTEEKPAF
jgi:predicted Zn-dependent protease